MVWAGDDNEGDLVDGNFEIFGQRLGDSTIFADGFESGIASATRRSRSAFGQEDTAAQLRVCAGTVENCRGFNSTHDEKDSFRYPLAGLE